MIFIVNKSRILAIVLLVFYLLALLSVLISGIHLIFKTLLLLAILASLADQVRRYLLRTHKDSLVQLKLADNEVIKVRTFDNADWLATEMTSSVVWPWILMLKLKELGPQARNFKLLIARDAVSREEFRQISLWVNQAMPMQTIKNQSP